MTVARKRRDAVGVPGLLLVLGGAALVLVSLRFLDWYDVQQTTADSAGNATFPTLHTSADQLGGAGVAIAYFNWLSWTLLIAVIVIGASATLPLPGADALRVTGFLLGLLGAVATYYALAQHQNAIGSKNSVFHNASWGVVAAIAGYLLAGLGAVLGPRKLRR